MKSYSSRELIKLLKKHRWREVRVTGDHHVFEHPENDRVIVVSHPAKDLPIGQVR
ncbi:MAG: type II toxin-antitoxin system HicA family toxin, partial [Alphaproteobacteria bacterium]